MVRVASALESSDSPSADPPSDPASDDPKNNEADSEKLSRLQIFTLLISVIVVATSGIAYELIIAAVSSYLIGNGVLQFSLTIGMFMLAMGIGSLISQRIDSHLVEWFIGIEILLAVLGGWSSSILFWAFPGYSLYRPVSWALILAIGTLVGLEIPILTRILSRASTWRSAIANVFIAGLLWSLDRIGRIPALPVAHARAFPGIAWGRAPQCTRCNHHPAPLPRSAGSWETSLDRSNRSRCVTGRWFGRIELVARPSGIAIILHQYPVEKTNALSTDYCHSQRTKRIHSSVLGWPFAVCSERRTPLPRSLGAPGHVRLGIHPNACSSSGEATG